MSLQKYQLQWFKSLLHTSQKKVNTTPELRNMLVVADRLKITLKQVLEMSETEYNTWLGYFMLEQEEYNRNRKI